MQSIHIYVHISRRLDVYRNRSRFLAVAEEAARRPQGRQAAQVACHTQIGQILRIATETVPALPVLKALAFLDHLGTDDVVSNVIV